MAASPIQPNPHMSMQSLNSQEQLEVALRDLIKTTGNKRGWCHGEPITDAGKRRQLGKMIVLILTPVIILVGITLYFISINALARSESTTTRVRLEFSLELGQLVHTLQQERDQSVLYLSYIGPETKNYLLKRYIATDAKVSSLSRWPVNFDVNKKEHFMTKRNFQKYLSRHRNELDPSQGLYEEIEFYTNSINVFSRWLQTTITESRNGVAWKSLVAYQKLISCKEDVGIERALGSAFFSRGGFATDDLYEWYNQKVNVFRFNYQSATNYSSLVDPIASYKLQTDNGKNLTTVIEAYRAQIQIRNESEPSLRKASAWFDAMTIYMDLLLEVQLDLSVAILKILDSQASTVTGGIIVSCLLLLIVLVMCPFLIRSVYNLTNNIQGYALTLADKTKELNREKRRTDSLLYQMLPRPVADQLKLKKDVNAEYYKEITIFFSDIVGFTSFSQQCTPMQIVDLLNNVYTVFDARIELYDVYKVETIGDSYMVASGLPKRNGNRHASEIANMALDMLSASVDLEINDIKGKILQLRVGVHTGPVVAGVVGTKLPRYCLFGDTVNTASRMETNGMPNNIHISHTTHKLLARHGGYVFKMRGPIDIKGKGQMVTFWLQGHESGEVNSMTKLHSQSSTDSVPYRRNSRHRWGKDSEEVTGGGKLMKHNEQEEPKSSTDKTRRISVISSSETERQGSGRTTQGEKMPPSYEDLEKHIEANKDGNSMVQLVEGYHF